ncbi:MAG: SHOCT domain-containing protein, partial [Actinomycetota bacterium]
MNRKEYEQRKQAYETLSRLAELREAGVLSEEEFSELKKELLPSLETTHTDTPEVQRVEKEISSEPENEQPLDRLETLFQKGLLTEAEFNEERQAQAEAEAEAERQRQAEAERQAQAEAEAEAERQAQAEAEAEAERQAQAEAERQAQAEAEAERQAQAEAERQAQAEAEAERHAQAEADRQAQAV